MRNQSIDLLFKDKPVEEIKQLEDCIDRNNTTDDAFNNTYEEIKRS